MLRYFFQPLFGSLSRVATLGSVALIFALISASGSRLHAVDTGMKGEASVRIEGMTCGGCEGTIQEKVAASPLLKDKVASCTANAKDGVAKIKFKDGASMTQEELESAMAQALKETSYTVGASKKAAARKSK